MNLLISKTVTTDIVTELVTVDEIKSWLKISFDDDDTIIAGLIKQARIYLENMTNLAMGTKVIEIIVDLQDELYYLPAPLVSIASFKRWNGSTFEDTDNFEIFNNAAEVYEWGRYKISVNCGYTSLPSDLRFDIYKLVAWSYQNRGLDFSNENTSLVDFPKLDSEFYKQVVI